MNVLLLNAGSSSLKAAVLPLTGDQPIARAAGDWAGAISRYEFTAPDGATRHENVDWRGHRPCVERVLRDLFFSEDGPACDRSQLAAIGHRVVHGGEYSTSQIVTPQVRERIAQLAALAPLHNPPSLEALAAAEAELPDLPHVTVFDTAFHATLPRHTFTYPIPLAWTRDWNIRRYGFHGLNHAYCAARAANMLQRPVDELRTVICHLGHGCSAAAVRGGRCVDTTMGFTPLEGLMMATRSGSIDPGLLLHLQQRHGLSADQLETVLNRESGLKGVSGISADMRRVLQAASKGDEQARLAIDIYTHRIRQAIGALAVTLGGVDVLVFTAGVGEHAAPIRTDVCQGLQCLGLELDPLANNACAPDADIAAASSGNRILVIAAREDLAMRSEVARVIAADI